MAPCTIDRTLSSTQQYSASAYTLRQALRSCTYYILVVLVLYTTKLLGRLAWKGGRLAAAAGWVAGWLAGIHGESLRARGLRLFYEALL